MAGNKEKIVIIGDGETAELAYEYFTSHSNFEVAGFSAERKFMHNHRLLGLPVVPFEEIERVFDPDSHKAFVAVSYTQLNRLRRRLLNQAKEKGYASCSYISPRASIAKTVEIGGNCFILENTSVQRGVKIGDNVTVWSGTSIGHRSIIGDNCFLATQVAISGFCRLGENCFFGVNSCMANNLSAANDCVIGAGAVLVENAVEGKIYVGNPAKPLLNRTTEKFISGDEQL